MFMLFGDRFTIDLFKKLFESEIKNTFNLFVSL